jgi:hypothetical protein
MIGVNVYSTLATYVGSDIDTIEKPQGKTAVTTCPAQSSFDLTRTGPIDDCDATGVFASNPNPAQEAGKAGVGWVVADPDPTNSGFTADWVDLIKVTKNKTTGDPVIGKAKCVDVPSYSPPPPAVQKAAPPILPYTNDTLDGRITHAVIAVDPRIAGNTNKSRAIWTGHTVAGGAGSEFDWYEINVDTATTFQTGVVSDPNLYVYNGAIASDRRTPNGGVGGQYGSNMVVGFSTSGSNAFPAIQMVSKIGANAQSAFVLIKQSPGPNASFSCSENPIFPAKCRWGDYSGAVPDPNSPTTDTEGRVWLANQWVTGEDGTFPNEMATWRTWIWRAKP